jgi:GT2 family glycosyltransferase
VVRNPENVGFARANNQAMRLARGRWFLLLNSDAALVDDTVARLVGRVSGEPGLGVAHCRLTLADGRLQHSTYRFPSLGLAVLENLGLYKLLPAARRADALLAGYWDHDSERDVDWVSGAFMLLPREVFARTGGFSEEYFMYGEDMEWCYRIRQAGWRIRYYPQASVCHQDHGSSDQRWGDRRIAICIRREIEIYRKQHGALAGSAFTLVKTLGSLVRVAYFGVGALVGGRQRDYYRSMTRYHALSLRVHAAVAAGQR